MAGRDDEVDPSDWLAAQFGEPDEVPAPAAAPPPVAPPAPAYPPAAPVYPPAAFPPAATPAPFPPAAAPVAPPASPPPRYPPTFPPAQSAPAAAPAPETPTAAGGFSWGLTPGVDPAAAAAAPVAPMPPVAPPAPMPPAPPVAPPASMPTVAPTPPMAPPAPTPSFDQPTQAFPYVPAATAPEDTATQAMPVPGQDLEAQPYDPARWLAAPVDASLVGATEVIEAEIVGIPTPVDEGAPTSAIDSLFGESAFQEYSDDIISAPPPRATSPAEGAAPPRGPRPPLPKVQKILLSVAGGLLGVLALVALFLLGTKLPALMPAAEPTPTPTPTATAPAFVLGPVEPGEYAWDELLGGECLEPWESAWQDRYTVVDCATPHAAQMVVRGTFDDEATAGYPGFDELQKRINLLCTAPTVIDYAATGGATDIQVTASFAVDETDWLDGNRTYFCFVNRANAATFTNSIAIPQVAPTPAPSETPAG